MKCQNCGNEIEEGHLICEVCGNEIQIVPDFEPELENSITEALSTLAALQEEEAKEEQTTAKEPEPAAAKGHVRKEIEPVEADDEYDEEEEKQKPAGRCSDSLWHYAFHRTSVLGVLLLSCADGVLSG